MKKSTLNTLIWLTLFSVAMGFMETAVVVYLRKIYYPDGFQFPLVPIDNSIVLTEIIREAATLVMLVGAGIFTGRNRSEKFGFFLYSFAIWDIFYYVFLKLLLDWPASLLTWDVLFLIPVTWVGPVIGPVINSLTMIVFALMLSWFMDKKASVKIKLREWLFLISGSLVVIISYTLDYSRYMVDAFGFSVLVGENTNKMQGFDKLSLTLIGDNADKGQGFDRLSLTLIGDNADKGQAEVIAYAAKYVPQNFDWWIFVLGEVLILMGMVLLFQREKRDIT